MSPPHFPISPVELRGDWSFTNPRGGHAPDRGSHRAGSRDPPQGWAHLRVPGVRREGHRCLSVRSLAPHDRTRSGRGRRVPPGRGRAGVGVDLLLHDAQYTAAELADRGHFGHAAVEYAVGLAKETGVGRLILFHHDPNRTDDQLDRLVEELDLRGVDAEPAVEGTTLQV